MLGTGKVIESLPFLSDLSLGKELVLVSDHRHTLEVKLTVYGEELSYNSNYLFSEGIL